jgi:hypothetical protein
MSPVPGQPALTSLIGPTEYLTPAADRPATGTEVTAPARAGPATAASATATTAAAPRPYARRRADPISRIWTSAVGTWPAPRQA